MQRPFLVPLGLTVLLTVSPLAAGAASAPRPDRAAVGLSRAEAGHGDRNGDRVDDGFEPRLAAAAPGDRFDVIVTGVGVQGARSTVGAFAVRHRLPLIDGFSATMTAGQARALARRPGVHRVEAVTMVHALDDGTSRDFGVTAAVADRPGRDGSGVGICVVDTGIDPLHEQIAPRTVVFKDFIGTGTTAYDDQGHGTHVASIAAGDGGGGSTAATFAGVAPAADLYAAKVLDASGNGPNDVVVSGVQWCVAQTGVQVLSMSLGDTVGGNGTDALSLAVNAAVDGGDVVAVAAGNSGDQSGTINSPGTAAGAITVGAVAEHSNPAGTERHDDGIWLAAFSSRGPTVDGRIKPDIAAPGLTVSAAKAGTVSGYVALSGTSMATPFVAGALALAREADPNAMPAKLRAALTSTARDVGAPGTDNEWGAGLIDVRALVDAVTGATTPRRTSFPAYERFSGTVPTNGRVDLPIVVGADALGQPLAATVTVAGALVCTFPFLGGCLAYEWSPDLDVQLLRPDGTVAATSDCSLSGLSCGVGRQETVGVAPTVAGTWTLRVLAFTGNPNNGKGGAFAADVFHGPTGTAAPPPPPPANRAPVANAGPDLTVRANRSTKLGTFTLDGRGSSDPDGNISTYEWSAVPGSSVGAGSLLSLSRPIGTYTFRLTVTDVGGLSATDDVKVTVRR